MVGVSSCVIVDPQDDDEVKLALFLSKTQTNAIMMYRQGGPGPIGDHHSPLRAHVAPSPGPPSNKPGPIGPPRSKGPGGMLRGGRGADFNEFYADMCCS